MNHSPSQLRLVASAVHELDRASGAVTALRAMSVMGSVRPQRYHRPRIISPHPEERRFLAVRLEGWQLARPRLLPSFETAAQEGGLLRMRTFNSSQRSKAGDEGASAINPLQLPLGDCRGLIAEAPSS